MSAGQSVYVSGLVGIDAATGQLAGSTIQEQTRQALGNCKTILKEAKATLERVVEVGTHVDRRFGHTDVLHPPVVVAGAWRGPARAV